jgi:hypothetical protein
MSFSTTPFALARVPAWTLDLLPCEAYSRRCCLCNSSVRSPSRSIKRRVTDMLVRKRVRDYPMYRFQSGKNAGWRHSPTAVRASLACRTSLCKRPSPPVSLSGLCSAIYLAGTSLTARTCYDRTNHSAPSCCRLFLRLEEPSSPLPGNSEFARPSVELQARFRAQLQCADRGNHRYSRTNRFVGDAVP